MWAKIKKTGIGKRSFWAGILLFFLSAAVVYLYPQKVRKSPIRVTAIFGSEEIPFWEEVRKGLREKAKEREIILTEYSPKDESLFPLLIESAYYTDVDVVAICIYETDMWKECEPLLKKMREKGIKIIVADTPPETEEYDVFIGLDNYAIGQKMAENIYQNYEEGQAILMDSPDVQNLVLGQRANGFKDRIEELGLFDMVDCISMTKDSLERVHIVKESLGNIENSAVLILFTANATKDVAKIVHSENLGNKIRLVGFGELPEAAEYVENGMVDVFFVQDNQDIGSKVIEASEALLDSDLFKNQNWNVDVLVYSKEE